MIPLLDQAVSPAGDVSGEAFVMRFRPEPNDVAKSIHDRKIQNVFVRVNTTCMDEAYKNTVMSKTPGERLREARLEHYGSAAQAAESRGWTTSTYTSHENGTRNFNLDDAQKYARAFGCGWIWLLTGIEADREISQAGAAALDLIEDMDPATQIQAISILQALANTPDEQAS